jgi:putative effector of murein hydrolase
VNEVAGIFAGIAMGLNALLTAILVPFALALLAK